MRYLTRATLLTTFVAAASVAPISTTNAATLVIHAGHLIAEAGKPATTNQSIIIAAGKVPIAIPSTPRIPSLLTPTAIITATETMRPASRTFT